MKPREFWVCGLRAYGNKESALAIHNEKHLIHVREVLPHEESALEVAVTRIEGMILSLEKHGQQIDVMFHIDWLKKALAKIRELEGE